MNKKSSYEEQNLFFSSLYCIMLQICLFLLGVLALGSKGIDSLLEHLVVTPPSLHKTDEHTSHLCHLIQKRQQSIVHFQPTTLCYSTRFLMYSYNGVGATKQCTQQAHVHTGYSSSLNPPTIHS